ncbi:hypothetical protein LINPERPRIM_LOCUS5276 [Linum perenne]
MGYNEVTGQVTADEEVWALAKVANTNAGIFKKKGCPEYPKMCSLFGDTSATRAFAKSSRHPLNDDGDQDNVIDEFLGDPTNVEVLKPDEGKDNEHLFDSDSDVDFNTNSDDEMCDVATGGLRGKGADAMSDLYKTRT